MERAYPSKRRNHGLNGIGGRLAGIFQQAARESGVGPFSTRQPPATLLDCAFLICSQLVATQSTKPCIGCKRWNNHALGSDMFGPLRKLTRNSDRGLHPPIKNLATPVHSPHLSFTSIFPKFSPLNNLRKAVGAFSMPCSMVSFHVILPSCIHPDISLWNSGM
jgi:hypothetical protein